MCQIGRVFSDFEQSLNDQGQCRRRRAACRRTMTSDNDDDDGTTWTYRVNLTKYPTEPNELHITMKDGTLTLSGKSEVANEGDFKVFLHSCLEQGDTSARSLEEGHAQS